ncbi:hypothetical protein [Paraburkholderia solisilvae]|nr:hypothetical protein [Paraburkholderia solisilvae]
MSPCIDRVPASEPAWWGTYARGPRKIGLYEVNPSAYTSFVPETTGNLDWRPERNRRTTAAERFFYVRTPARALFNGRALAGEPSGSPVSYSPVRQPRHVPGHPNWRWEPGCSTRIGGRTMLRQATARPGQPESLSTIVREALRTAALAPDLAAALDVAGAALIDIAQLARDDQPSQREQAPVREIFCTIQRVADETLGALERAACIFAAIDRLTRDTDEPVNELALIGRSLVSSQSEALDSTFTGIAYRMSRMEACHG